MRYHNVSFDARFIYIFEKQEEERKLFLSFERGPRLVSDTEFDRGRGLKKDA